MVTKKKQNNGLVFMVNNISVKKGTNKQQQHFKDECKQNTQTTIPKTTSLHL